MLYGDSSFARDDGDDGDMGIWIMLTAASLLCVLVRCTAVTAMIVGSRADNSVLSIIIVATIYICDASESEYQLYSRINNNYAYCSRQHMTMMPSLSSSRAMPTQGPGVWPMMRARHCCANKGLCRCEDRGIRDQL